MNVLTEITQALIEMEEEIMLPVWMSNALAAVGISVGIVACMRAIYEGRNRHKRVIDAANDQETWARAYEIETDMNANPEKYKKYGRL